MRSFAMALSEVIMTANRSLDMQAMVLEETETEIRLLIKQQFFNQTPQAIVQRKVNKLIAERLKQIKIPELRTTAQKSLRNFAQRQYLTLKSAFASQLVTLTAFIALSDDKSSSKSKAAARRALEREGYSRANLYGVPLQKYSQEYFRKNVNPVLDRLSKQYALDPDDVANRNSLRNRAEMEVCYQANLDNIEQLKNAGYKLVIASAHADCSERCRPWQGKVYSLDSTRGITDDGRGYRPLEDATDICYTTKKGKRYKNGLLGFNCRHYLVPYRKGYHFPKPNPAEERRQYEITKKQRELERHVREWKIKAVEAKGVNHKEYAEAKKKATQWRNRYVEYSKFHKRAYYPSRIII